MTHTSPAHSLNGTSAKKELSDTEKVTLYLKRNPDVLKKFIVENPDVVNKLTFPTETPGGITQFYAFRAHKLQKELAHLKTRNRLLIQTSTDNLESQHQIHQLALDILAATSIQHLLATVRTYLNEQMDVDHAHLCILEDAPLAQKIHACHQTVHQEAFSQIFKNTSQTVVLRTLYEDEDKAIHGEWAKQAASDGLLRIQTPQTGIDVGFLALISSQKDRFHPAQGVELLTFIAKIMGHVMENWITTTPNQKNCQKIG